MMRRHDILASQPMEYSGIPVFVDNAYYEKANGTVSNYATGSDWFIAGPFDTGTEGSKSITFSYATVKPTGGMSFRLFNDTAGTSVDYWDMTYSTGQRTVTTAGRYVYASLSKSDAANMYMYMTVDGVTTYIYKGNNV